jgi:hypothetical protein
MQIAVNTNSNNGQYFWAVYCLAAREHASITVRVATNAFFRVSKQTPGANPVVAGRFFEPQPCPDLVTLRHIAECFRNAFLTMMRTGLQYAEGYVFIILCAIKERMIGEY